ncbi:MAG: tetratricopeptide repeat protein [bacterium]|nr:tetratricopeptide repeat protein [bacterium]
MEDALLEKFISLMGKDIGLRVREQNRAAFHKVVEERVRTLGGGRVEAYGEILASDTETGEKERERLTRILSVGESYFFRDTGQFELLRETILPDLMARNAEKASLRIWSAGCATGEEPYSLAILLDEMLPDQRGWKIEIIGTDIHEASLEQAKRGVYREWSFRGVAQRYRDGYFEKAEEGWSLRPDIRSRVQFRAANLIRDAFPDPRWYLSQVDLILCRNVFIYFDRKVVADVLPKFADTLKDGGYLMMGHAELYDQDLGRFHVRVFPRSVLYQHVSGSPLKGLAEDPGKAVQAIPIKKKQKIELSVARRTNHTVGSQALEAKPEILTDKLQSLLAEGDYQGVITAGLDLLRSHPGNVRVCCLVGFARANVGDYPKAIEDCQKAIEGDAFDKEPYYLLAHLYEEQGLIDRAKELYRKCIYLDPKFAPPYMQLGMIYEKEGDTKRARRTFQSALKQLKNMRPDDLADPFGDDRVKDRVEQIENWL